MTSKPNAGPLEGLRVVELGDETVEYCGLLLMGLGAEVVKVEPPGGGPSRKIGPFVAGREGDPEASLFFWHYNRGKKSVLIDRSLPEGGAALLGLLEGADVLLRSVSPATVGMPELGGSLPTSRFDQLIDARISPFGEAGPWSEFKGSDLVHLALGGVMANCGYDPEPNGGYDLPPVAPAMWHSYHIVGEQVAIGILAALLSRAGNGKGQEVVCAIHEAVAKCTEADIMSWVMRRAPMFRQTCRHSAEVVDDSLTIASPKDGRWVMSMLLGDRDAERLFDFVKSYGLVPEIDHGDEAQVTGGARDVPGTAGLSARGREASQLALRLVRQFTFGRVPWQQAQEAGILWAPLRRPEENLEDKHWWQRESLQNIAHNDPPGSYAYPVSKWVSDGPCWQAGGRAPHLGEHTAETRQILRHGGPPKRPPAEARRAAPEAVLSRWGKPWVLEGVRILDFSWFLASAGGTRFAAAFGAECIKVEWSTHPDTRLAAMAPVGGREARRGATGPLRPVSDPDMGGQFNNKNPGKLGLALNVRHPRGLEIARELVRICDVVAEGFSPGVLQRWGLGYDVMRELNPRVIYVQQSGMGRKGTYGRFRTIGPVAASIGGLSEMSGLPEPAMPAGWGYSYLDWIGAYSFAQALLSALYYREVTGEGQCIDASQVEAGLFVTGTAMLNWQVNGQRYERAGNRSPWKKAAPSGAFPTAGDDRWLALTCHSDDEWRALARVANHDEWLADPRFASLDARLAHQDQLEDLVRKWTSERDGVELMYALQGAGVPAGVCQTAEDRCDNDPQLAHLKWLTEVTGTKIGTWPVVEVPVRLSATPAYIGGRVDRGAPCYGEDTERVLSGLLGLSEREIADLRSEGVVE